MVKRVKRLRHGKHYHNGSPAEKEGNLIRRGKARKGKGDKTKLPGKRASKDVPKPEPWDDEADARDYPIEPKSRAKESLASNKRKKEKLKLIVENSR
jgi:hypothetical protein